MSANIKVNINTEKIKKEFDRSFDKARLKVKAEIVKDCGPLVPFREGTLQRSVIASQTKDDRFLIWNTPYARFLYGGLVMVGRVSKSPWAKHNEEKIVKEPKKKLTFYRGTNPKAGAEWFDRAKNSNIQKWLNIYAKGGKR